MTLRLVDNGDPRGSTGPTTKVRPKERIASAPESEGTIPLGLARLLQRGEPVVWWGEKDSISWRPVATLAVAGASVLALASAFVPELWSQPWRAVLRTVVLTQVPAAAFLAREWFGRRAVVVTDQAIADLRRNTKTDRLQFGNVRRVRRDWLSGGLILRGERHEVRIPPSLLDDAREAIASQMTSVLGTGAEGPDDPAGWFPRPGR